MNEDGDPARGLFWGCLLAAVLWLVIIVGIRVLGDRRPLAEAVAWHEMEDDRW